MCYLVSKAMRRLTVKSSISFQLKDDRPGGLLEIMEFFRDKGINLTKIESRPGKHHLGRYISIIEGIAFLYRKTSTIRKY